jgi:thiazole synthase ThiGH ThiG subunit
VSATVGVRETDRVELEVIGDDRTLLVDAVDAVDTVDRGLPDVRLP